jgi:hypothetical protein
VYRDELSIENERLAIMKEKLAIQTKDPTDEQRREIAEQEAKINGLYRQQADELRGLSREKNAAIKASEKELEILKEKNKLEKINISSQEFAPVIKGMNDLRTASQSAIDQVSAVYQVLGKVASDISGPINDAFTSMAEGFGEFIGALATGDAGLKDFGRMIAGVFADLAINVGKIAIGAGMAVLGIKEALMTLNPWVAIAAGVALVALGYAIKGSLKSAAMGSSGTGSIASAGSNSFTYDTRAAGSLKAQPITIKIEGKLTADGPSLKYVLDQEVNRRMMVNGS